MDNRPVLFLDSGIGCLPYASFFHSRNPAETLICVADRANFPYGQKTKEYLIDALSSLTEKSISLFNPKIMAIACNTASVSALSALREKFPALHIVGTVPAIKPAVLASKKRRIGVLGTKRTIDDPYIMELAAKHGPDCEVIGEAAPELVEFAEHCWADASKEERLSAVKPWTEKLADKGADAVVLACTHFLLLKEEFQNCGLDLMIFDSVEGICHRVEFFLDADNGCLRSGKNTKEKIILKITGERKLEPYWEKMASCFGVIPEIL